MNIVTGLPDLSLACTRNESATTLMLVNPDCCRLFVNCCRRLEPPGCGLVVVAAEGAEPELGFDDCARAKDETVVRIAAATRVVFFIAKSPFWIVHQQAIESVRARSVISRRGRKLISVMLPKQRDTCARQLMQARCENRPYGGMRMEGSGGCGAGQAAFGELLLTIYSLHLL